MRNLMSALLALGALMMAEPALASGLAMATEWEWARDGGRIVNSVVVLGGIGYLLGRILVPVVRKRANDIRNEINELVEAREMAEQSLADYQLKLQEIKSEQEKALAEAAQEADNIRRMILEQAEQAASGVLKRAGDQIEMETEQARLRLRGETSMLVIAAAEELLKRNIGPADHKTLLREYISKMEKNN